MCTVWRTGTDANVTFGGPKALAYCADIRRRWEAQGISVQEADPKGTQVCAAKLQNSPGDSFVVADVGGQYYGKQLCTVLLPWARGGELGL